MRKPFVAGNWKMNLTRSSALLLVKAIATELGDSDTCEVAVCPPSLYVSDVVKAAAGSRVGVGAQNCYCQPEGAFTGEVSAAMVADTGSK